jgi:hypothetical protein
MPSRLAHWTELDDVVAPHRRPRGATAAQHLLRVASDDAATPHERQSAYAKARHELDGLMVLPAITRAGIERRIAGEIEA